MEQDTKKLTQLSFAGFQCEAMGLLASETLTLSQWEDAGHALGAVSAKLNWYIGDWLGACKGETWGYGDLEETCKKFELNYQTARNAKSVCDSFELSRRRDNLTFTHHQEVQGREDADELLDWCEKTSVPKTIKDLREEKRKRNNLALVAKDLPAGKYNVIYADPPWQYNSGDQHTTEEQDTVLGTHYPSMPLNLICEMPIDALASEGCVLFIWATSPTLEECFQVINSWGFDYKASMIWDKVLHNVGHYVSVRHELLLICTKGQTPHVPKLVDSVYTEERTKHSRKPEFFRQTIEAMYPKAKRIELFAREKTKGWSVWGNQL
jgi:N6-adenosine-specific RNA methylase IME4